MEWFEDKSFWRDFYPYMFDEARWAKAFGQVESVARIAGGHDAGERSHRIRQPGLKQSPLFQARVQ